MKKEFGIFITYHCFCHLFCFSIFIDKFYFAINYKIYCLLRYIYYRKLLFDFDSNKKTSRIKQAPTDILKSVGAYYLFSAIQYLLSVGAFFERPRANTVRPYRGLHDFSDKDITLCVLFLIYSVYFQFLLYRVYHTFCVVCKALIVGVKHVG